ncbi:unnamed protein product, partial [Chrysoparadoxa australica]
NNIFSHTGTPDITAFTCDISSVGLVGGTTPTATCTIDNPTLLLPTIAEYEYCSRRGICSFATGTCSCLAGWGKANCGTQSYAYAQSSNDLPGMTLTASSSSYAGSIMQLEATRSKSADFNFLECTAADTPIFTIKGSGNIQLAELVVTGGGQTIEVGGELTNMDGAIQ